MLKDLVPAGKRTETASEHGHKDKHNGRREKESGTGKWGVGAGRVKERVTLALNVSSMETVGQREEIIMVCIPVNHCLTFRSSFHTVLLTEPPSSPSIQRF